MMKNMDCFVIAFFAINGLLRRSAPRNDGMDICMMKSVDCFVITFPAITK
jgi:hypothetical protein